MGIKAQIGQWLFPRLPVSRHTFDHMRMELNALHSRIARWVYPTRLIRSYQYRQQTHLRVNIGCGPFGLPGWVNMDLFAHPGVTFVADCRRSIPLKTGSCQGIHVEHYLEHLDPVRELPVFISECRRCLAPDGVLRVIVPDAAHYLRAYLAPGWTDLNAMTCGGDIPEKTFPGKMDAVNHVFLQNGEHFGGFDEERLGRVLLSNGFGKVRVCQWREGDFTGGCIDREQHRPYSLYAEAQGLSLS